MTKDADYWKNDLLARKEDAILLHQFLVRRMKERMESGRAGSYVLNLDAGWGHGKSFFLTGFKLLLEANEHKVVLVNAWEDDYAEDPLLAVVSSIERAFPKGKGQTAAKKLAAVGSQIAATAAKHVVKTMVAKVVGTEGVKAIVDAAGAVGKAGADAAAEFADQTTEAAGKALLARFAEGKEAIADFRTKLRALIEKSELKPPLFILIDEVDRCRPSYAITLLERVKHLFEVDGVVFVIATDTEQLRHSVSAVYGAGFDGRGYLLRFFDRTYKFATPERDLLIEKMLSESGIDLSILSSPAKDNHTAFITSVAAFFNLTPRELDRCFDILRSVTTMWPPKKCKIQLLYLLPLIVGYCREDKLFLQLSTLEADSVFLISYQKAHVAITFDKISDFGAPAGSESHPLPDILWYFQQLAEKSKKEILNMDRTTAGMRAWVAKQFFDEAYQSQHLTTSLSAKEYPDLVRRVARLSDDQK